MASGRGWCAEKIRKVQKYDAEIARRNSDSEVWADYFYGRKVWSPDLTHREWEQRRYDSFKNQLSSHDKWVVAVAAKCGITVNVNRQEQKKVLPTRSPQSAVYLQDGYRKLFATADEALEYFVLDERAVKMWDAENREYLTK